MTFWESNQPPLIKNTPLIIHLMASNMGIMLEKVGSVKVFNQVIQN